MVLNEDDDTQIHSACANTNPAPDQTVHPQSFAPSKAVRRGECRGVDESLNRPKEGHTGAVAIPETTYLLSCGDNAVKISAKIHSQPGTG